MTVSAWQPWSVPTRLLRVCLQRIAILFTASLLVLALPLLRAQETGMSLPKSIASSLSTPLADKASADWEIRKHLIGRVHAMPQYPGDKAWVAQRDRMRAAVLRDYILSGWPEEMIDWRVRVTETDVLHPEPAIAIHKLTLEVLPHFFVTALLYVPQSAKGKVPAILDVIGHEKDVGIAVPYQQTLCMDEARMGMYALNLEWTGIGDLSMPENAHAYLAHLDVTGRRGAGLFYLADRKALDYLASLPGVDPARIGMTGLSGGGLQTVLLSSLDPRIAVAVEVAGFAPGVSRVERSTDQGDMEQVPPDFLSGVDYTTLLTLRAPRPTMLIHNAMDSCCYRAELVKPIIYAPLMPFFRNDPDLFAWHTNYVPGTHNYERDNRYVSLTFFAKHFGIAPPRNDLEEELTLLSKDSIDSPLPTDALTVLRLASQFADANRPDSRGKPLLVQREILAQIARFTATRVQHAWPIAIATENGIEATRYRFQFADGLSAYGVFLRRLNEPTSPARIILTDGGVVSSAAAVQTALMGGGSVLSLELTLTTPALGGSSMNLSELLASLGERPLGLGSAQLLALSEWLRQARGTERIVLQTVGPRTQLIGLLSQALQPHTFDRLEQTDTLGSLHELFTKPMSFRAAPEFFCLGLQQHFEISDIEHLADTKP